LRQRLAFGIDLGGTQLRAAVVDCDGAMLSRAAIATDVAGGPRQVVEQIKQLCAQVCSAEQRPHIAGVGVSAPGPLDSDTGTVLGIPTLPGWQDMPLGAILAEQFGLPVIVENDGIAAANGEWKFGSARGLSHFVYVTVSTGIGGGVVVDGHLLHGRRGMAGHVGHMVVVSGGPVCSCGAHGCFEALASGSALGRAGREAAAAHPASLLAAHAPGSITARDIVEAARAGDRLALTLLDREAAWLGIGFCNLLHLYSPQAIIMGGGVSQAFDLLLPGIASVVRSSAMPAFRDAQIVAATLGDNAGLAGAASLVWERQAQSG
jgi:glucokinase